MRNTFGIITLGIGVLLLAGPAFGLSFGAVSTASVAQGNVYDIYGIYANGTTVLIAGCQSFDTYLADAQNPTYQAQYPGGVSAATDSACGPIVLTTSTTVSGTTFTNAVSSGSTVTVIGGTTSFVTTTVSGTVTTSTQYFCGNIQYNPATQTCNAQTSTVTNTATSTTTALTTSVITVTQSGTTTLKTVTQAATGSGLPFGLVLSQVVGVLFIVLGGATFVTRRRKG